MVTKIKRYLMMVLLAFAAGQTMWAQGVAEAEYPYRRDIEKGKYDRAAEKIHRRISRDSDNLECHYAAYKLYSTPDFASRNADTAYLHLVRVRALYAAADEKSLEKWSRDSYSGALIDSDLRRIGRMALSDAHAIRTPDGYQHYLNFYTLAPADLRDSAADSRDSLEFDIARRAATVAQLQVFIDRRPNANVTPDAIRLRDSLAFEDADRKHTYAAYQLFRSTYPQSHLYGRATDSVYALEFRDALQHDGEQYYRSYAERYQQSPYAQRAVWLADSIEYRREADTSDWQSMVQYIDMRNRKGWNDTAARQLAQYALRHSHVRAAICAAQRLKEKCPLRQELAEMLHDAYIRTSIRNYDKFYHGELPALVGERQRAADSAAYSLYLNYDYSIIDSCIRRLAPCHEAMLMLQSKIKDDLDHRRWAAATATAEEYADAFGNDYDYRKLIAALQEKADAGIKATALGAGVNSDKGDEFAPVISADGRTLYFAGKNRSDNIGGEDVYASRLTKKGWEAATLVMDLSHTYGNEAPISISIDNNTLLLFQSGTIYQADRTGETWMLHQLPGSINGSSWQADAMIAASGRDLVFAAKGLTDREADSSLNLYVSHLDSHGRWGKPTELGKAINTPFDERSPYLHPDMRTLYFSSEGHGSIGQMDMYVATRIDDSWTNWSEPVNIGKEANTSGDDWGYKITTDGRKVYFARQEGKTQDIYSVALPQRARPQRVEMVRGSIAGTDGRPIGVELRWEDPATGELLGQCRSDAADGHFTIALPHGKDYCLYVHDSSFVPLSKRIELDDESGESSKAATANTVHGTVLGEIAIPTYRQMAEDSITVTLENIVFESSTAQLSPSSTGELARIAGFIKQHRCKAEISCHVDGNIGDAANLSLTQRRAEAIRDRLVELGCRPTDIAATGCGSDSPLPYKEGERIRPQQRRTMLRIKYE